MAKSNEPIAAPADPRDAIKPMETAPQTGFGIVLHGPEGAVEAAWFAGRKYDGTKRRMVPYERWIVRNSMPRQEVTFKPTGWSLIHA